MDYTFVYSINFENFLERKSSVVTHWRSYLFAFPKIANCGTQDMESLIYIVSAFGEKQKVEMFSLQLCQ